MDIGSVTAGRAMEGMIPAREFQRTSSGNTGVAQSTSSDSNTCIGSSELSEEGKKNYQEKVGKAVDKLNKIIEDEDVYAKYEVHEKLNQIMVKLIDRNTNEVLLEVPSKKILDMVAKMCEMAGILLDKRA